MLLNQNNNIPDTFYIFINKNNPVTVNNLKVSKTFASAAYQTCLFDKDFREKYENGKINYLPYKKCDTDLRTITPYFLTAINDYRVEHDAEYYRKENYPNYPSRFSATFAFGDYDTCEKVSNKYGWDLSTVEEFELVRDSLTRVVRVNMEIVSLVRFAYKKSGLGVESINYIWEAYWSGKDELLMELPDNNFELKKYSSEVLHEYLIEGMLKLKE